MLGPEGSDFGASKLLFVSKIRKVLQEIPLRYVFEQIQSVFRGLRLQARFIYKLETCHKALHNLEILVQSQLLVLENIDRSEMLGSSRFESNNTRLSAKYSVTQKHPTLVFHLNNLQIRDFRRNQILNLSREPPRSTLKFKVSFIASEKLAEVNCQISDKISFKKVDIFTRFS